MDWRTVVRDADRSPPPAAPITRDAPAPSPLVATPSVRRPAQAGIPDVSQLAERWDDLVAAMRAKGNNLAATALEHSSAVAVNGKGDVTIALDEANPIYEQALGKDERDLTDAMRAIFAGVQRVVFRAPAASPPPVRLTDEMVRTERLTAMRRKDPVLDRAIDALDLDLAD
jgi:hypothetical protein